MADDVVMWGWRGVQDAARDRVECLPGNSRGARPLRTRERNVPVSDGTMRLRRAQEATLAEEQAQWEKQDESATKSGREA